LATLTHTYLGSFSLDPEDVRILSLGEICNFIEGRGTLRIGHQSKGYKGPAEDPHVLGTKRLEIINYSIPFNSNLSLIKAVPRLFSVKYYPLV